MNTNLIDTIAARSWIVKCKDKCNYSKHVKHSIIKATTKQLHFDY